MVRNAPRLKVDRFKQILTLVNSRKRISLTELEAMLHAPRITVQRDLMELENRNLVRRFHGGAMSMEFSSDFYNYDVKKTVHVEAKKKIAAKANRLLQENSAVCLDASSTVYYLSETIFPANMLALTCSIDAFRNLSAREDVQAVLAGGRINRKTATLYGPEMLDTIRKFHFDTAFISAEVFVPNRGFFDPHEEEVAVKRALIESSKKTVMMIDAAKIAPAAGIRVCTNDEIDFVITDTNGESPLKKIFKDRLL
jgi:DeoR/GlpR family transcriptional regulator of sugar metabolism